MTSPAKRMRLSSQRASLSGNQHRVTVTTPSQNALRTSTSNSALRTSQNAANRSATQQSSSFDIITGQPIDTLPAKPRRPSFSQSQQLKRSTSRPSLLPQPSSSVQTGAEKPSGTAMVPKEKNQEDTHNLQARVNKLEYELQNLQAERGMLTLQHEKELREAQTRADTDYRKYQDAETARINAVRQHETAMKEVRDTRDRGVNANAVTEKRLRELQTQCDQLEEEKEDLEGRLSEAEREMRRVQVEEVEGARSRLERTMQETTAELEEMKTRFDTVNSKLQEKELYAEEMEKKILELNNKTGGGEELEVLKREFSEQIENVRRLEKIEREQRAKIRKLEDERRSVNVVQEEKRALEVQVQTLKQIERKAGEMELQKEILEDEKRTWTSLLEGDNEDAPREFDSPEAVVKALVNTRIEHQLLLERLSSTESEIVGKDEALSAVESERNVLKSELAKLKDDVPMKDALATSAPEPESKIVKRLERQQQLAKKEIEFLRAQLEAFENEARMPENASGETKRPEEMQQLERLISEYKSEIDSLNSRITTLESQPAPVAQPAQLAGTKRKSEEPDDAGELGKQLRKNKNLQIALQKTTAQSQVLAKELQASKSQLKALRNSAQTRILELRDNPTAQHEAVKGEMLRTLKQENTELMAQLRGDTEAMSRVRVVPVSSLDALKLDLQDKDLVIADREKRMRRQREIWTEKAAEFRDVISSVLGYKVTFLPNGKVKVRSLYYNPTKDGEERNDEVAEEDREDYIEFDGEKGTMKIGGGRNSVFGLEINEQVNYWVGEKKEIPLFLAATQMEFYEKFGGMDEQKQ